MRNHSFSSLSTAYEHEIDRLDEDTYDPYDLNLSVSSLAKLNRRKPQVSTILKLNLIVVLVISLFIKLTVVSIINGSLSAFIALKLLTHGLILYAFLKKHYISLQLLFVLDVILFVIFLLFEFLLLVSNFAIIIIQHKRNKNLGFIGIWLMILIAAIDLLILVMVAIVLENYRRPKGRLQQLEAKLVTVVHNGRLLASQMCKSGSYLLGFVSNSSTAPNQAGGNTTAPTATVTASTNNGLLLNGTPRIYRDSEDPNLRISCINTQEASSFSLNDEEYVHYSSVDMTNGSSSGELANRFHSFSDFYNFNNRNANLNNETSGTVPCPTTNTVNTSTNISSIVTTTAPSNCITTTHNVSNTTSSPLSSILSSNLANPNNLNNLTNSVTTTGIPSLTTLATSSTFGAAMTSTQLQASLANHQATREQNRSLFERANPFKAMNGTASNLLMNNSAISSMISSNTNSITNTTTNSIKATNSSSMTTTADEDESTYVHMYQSNLDEDGDPVDGPLRCTRSTVINGSTESGPSTTSHTVVQMNRNAECVLNCKPVYI